MNQSRSSSLLFYTAWFLVAGGIAFLEIGPFHGRGGSLLLTLVLWIAVVEGTIAVAAVCEVVHARWIVTLKEELLSPLPLLPLLILLFCLLGLRLDLYPWRDHPGPWRNGTFFMTRNTVILFLTWGAAHRYVSQSRRADAGTIRSAVLYLFAFVLSQSMVAYDWVMPLDDPWYSTLFGPYFFVESIFCGLAVAGILYVIRFRRAVGQEGEKREYLRDLATLTFGFSILWGGLFFSQFLVIWYGNLPEEVVYLVSRVTTSPWRELSYGVPAAFFGTPFFFFLPRRAKTMPSMVLIVSLIILGGLLVERILMLKPLMPLSATKVLLESAGIFFLFFFRTGRQG